MRARVLCLLFGLAWPAAAGGQAAATVARTGVYFESYSFGSGLAFDRVSELTIPVMVVQRFGSRLTVDLGTAFASASVREPGGNTIDHSGFIDTDVRATATIIPGRLVFTVVGTLPTGAAEVPDTTIPLFGATATDLLGFTTPAFGSGGGLSAGFASAFKVGQNWAVGTGASYRYGASYTPVAGGGELAPGGEVRARFGVEGPFGGGKYFRGALVYTTTGANDLGGGGRSLIGDRALVYGAMSMPLGRSSLSFFAWNLRRLNPRNADTAAVVTPRGNVLALGARLNRPLSPTLTLAPMVEFRHELTGAGGGGGGGATMELLGYLLRTGADLRVRLSESATLVVQTQLAFGQLQDEGTRVSLFGPRLGTLIEWSR
ncbi:MAG TPA: hypothetical protein VGQ25_09775 [Gemmatimonadales bacterium]|jgi:hypothetical protein|nr:hypothetical protein [Gemmatimonadales bacterium]